MIIVHVYHLGRPPWFPNSNWVIREGIIIHTDRVESEVVSWLREFLR